MSKICAKCGEEKPNKDFSLNRAATDGLAAMCKECHKPYNKKYNKVITYLNMRAVYKYNHHYKLLSMYDNVLEAVQEEDDINSTDIYKACLGRTKKLQGARWSFDQILPKYMRVAIEEWIEQEM